MSRIKILKANKEQKEILSRYLIKSKEDICKDNDTNFDEHSFVGVVVSSVDSLECVENFKKLTYYRVDELDTVVSIQGTIEVSNNDVRVITQQVTSKHHQFLVNRKKIMALDIVTLIATGLSLSVSFHFISMFGMIISAIGLSMVVLIIEEHVKLYAFLVRLNRRANDIMERYKAHYQDLGEEGVVDNE